MSSLADYKIPLFPVNGVPRANTSSRAGNVTYLTAQINQLIDQLILEFEQLERDAGNSPTEIAEIATLKGAIQTLNQEIISLKGAGADYLARIATLETDNTADDQRLSALEVARTILDTAIGSLSGQITALQAADDQRLTSLESNTVNQDQLLFGHSGQITALQSAQLILERAIIDLRSDDGSDDQRIATLETTATNQGQTLSSVAGQITALQTASTSLNQAISALQTADTASAAFLALGPAGAIDTVDLTKGQLRFPANQKPSTNPRTLDDYLEFDWTPDIRLGGAAVGVTYGSRVGKGVKIGRMVFLSWSITLTSKGTSTGNCQINGSPYSADAVAALQAGFLGTTQVFYRANAGSSSLDLLTTANAAITDKNLANTSVLTGNLTFLTGN